jgi:hypothetical protein
MRTDPTPKYETRGEPPLHSYLAVLASLKGFRRPVLLLDLVPNLVHIKPSSTGLPVKMILNQMKARILKQARGFFSQPVDASCS